MHVTIKYSVNSLSSEIEDGTTVGDIKDDDSIVSSLRIPENTRTYVNNVAVEDSRVLHDGDTLVFERQAASKA